MNEYSPQRYSDHKALLVGFLVAVSLHTALFIFVKRFPSFGTVKEVTPPRLKVRLRARVPVKTVYDVQQFKPSRFFPEVPPPPKKAALKKPKKVVPKKPKKIVKPKAIHSPPKKAIRPVKKETVLPQKESSLPSKESSPEPSDTSQEHPPSPYPLTKREVPEIKQAAAPPPTPVKRELAYPDYGKSPALTYPSLAQRRGYEGRVILKVLVSKEGRALKVILAKSSGHSILDRAAMKAVREWIFKPGKLNGKPVEMWVKVPVVYELK